MIRRVVLFAVLVSTIAPARAQWLRDVIGVAHVDGKYSLAQDGRDFLSEGAQRIRYELGSRVIKLWLDGNPARMYPFHSPAWQSASQAGGIVGIANHRYFREVFSMPFTTYILVVDAPNGVWFQDGMTALEEAAEERSFYELTRVLMSTYAGTNKTFVLQNWEGDWLLRLDGEGRFLADAEDPQPAAVDGMIRWLNARQRGVERARTELADQVAGVTVRNAVEVNLVRRSRDEPSRISLTKDVLPSVTADLYSYSAWECLEDPSGEMLKASLTYLDEMTPGTGNVYVGEYGVPENVFGSAEHLDRVMSYTDAAVEWGALYVVYWQIYCNELAGAPVALPLNSDMRGFWLIRPDGTRSPAWDYLRAKMIRPPVPMRPQPLLQVEARP